MVRMSVTYTGEKHCELLHESSGTKIATDAPKDNMGRGESFSPTDLVAAGLASCMLTTMAIVAERDGLDFTTASATVEKVMQDKPRKIGNLKVHITLPASYSPEHRQKLERTALACPVHKSLHPDVQIPLSFEYV